MIKGDFRSSFKYHDCSGTASQVTPQGRRQHASASGVKVGFELTIDGIQCHPLQFYVFANYARHPLTCSTLLVVLLIGLVMVWRAKDG